MKRSVAVVGFVLAICLARSAAGQTPAQGEADPGVRPTRLIDRAEVRVSRVELQVGATRRVHAHDDVEYHLWIPIEGSLEITVRSDAPVAAKAGQAFFMTRGTPHGFKNVGTTPAAVFEIFVKQATAAAAADQNLLGALAAELDTPRVRTSR